MRQFQVWAEGYAATGEYAPATLRGVYEAETFDDAVRQHIKTTPEEAHFYRQHDDGHWSYWACRLYDNESDARKFLG